MMGSYGHVVLGRISRVAIWAAAAALLGAVGPAARVLGAVGASPRGASSSFAGSRFTGVSCTSRSHCIAVGVGPDQQALAAGWDGSSWSVQPVLVPGGIDASALNEVSCSSSISCTAVGSTHVDSGPDEPLAEAWNGVDWSIQPVPVPAGVTEAELRSVSCPSRTECMAVGDYSGPRKLHPLAERWQSGKWTIQSLPASRSQGLTGVSCPTVSNCTAVGGAVERWNGRRWFVQSARTDGHGVSCFSPSRCTAVSESDLGAEGWNGKRWSSQPFHHARKFGGYSGLFGVSCPARKSCLAVGSYLFTSDEGAPMAARWNGRTWSVRGVPEPSEAGDAELLGVSCTSPRACVAVGAWDSLTASGEASGPLASVWNGTTWSDASP